MQVHGIVIQGHGVASGQANDPRFPGGTLQMQKAAFQQRGLDLSPYFPGTINVSIRPHTYTVQAARYTFRTVKWASDRPAEDFSFFDCRIQWQDQTPQDGLIYYPHPETKPEHFQDPDTLEVLTGFIDGLQYGDRLTLDLDPKQFSIQWHPK